MAKQKNGNALEGEIKVTIKNEVKFTKSQLLNSNRFKDCRDLVNAIFEDDKSYTIEEAMRLVEDFMKGAIK